MKNNSEDKEEEETYIDRRRNYKNLVAGGMSDKNARDAVWPTTHEGVLKKAKEMEKRKQLAGTPAE